MDRELERKNKLLTSLNDYFTKRPKKIDPEIEHGLCRMPCAACPDLGLAITHNSAPP